jgi:hypothetical protein
MEMEDMQAHVLFRPPPFACVRVVRVCVSCVCVPCVCERELKCDGCAARHVAGH